MKFRNLKADEIEVRTQKVKKNGCLVLLYKDARVDQTILDETVGCMGWQRKHTRDNKNCIVSVWDETNKQWVEKEDTGAESNTQKEKGLASDSFKRACFNWGIGRELYSAKDIFTWINLKPDEVAEDGKDNYGKPKYKLNYLVKFYVSKIEVKAGKITGIRISDQNDVARFSWVRK